MIILSNSIAQTVAPGQSLTFDTVILKTGCAECWRPNTGVVNLAARNSIYATKFHGNIGNAAAAGTAQLAISIDNSPLLETTMISTTAAAGDLNNVGCDTSVKTCYPGGYSVTVTNTGTDNVEVGAHPCLSIKRVA